ncbi:3'-5' exonuclease [Jiella marina]|uniref:3'-5' exonuclease n=1 Tax=Jiella sp. LLJ827 TaxID=2917712 RepID=UPI00210080AC|nr:3'-5' exonuclease [Jiella sp. LLJ827]MCQ0987160.1 UvrD-helicase domain-containing protein [Jiella sp. LLJ827]
MSTVLSDTFQVALGKLTNDEQKQVKITVFDLQTDPSGPGLKFHRIDKSKDENFWSVRVSRDIRIIVHKLKDSLALVYVDHHDDAYKWAERRRMEVHEKTGALQIVEVRERVVEIDAPIAVQAELFGGGSPLATRSDIGSSPTASSVSTEPQPKLFAALSEDDLLSVGVPRDWLADIAAADEERFFQLAGHLPSEAGEALLDYAATGILKPAAAPVADPMQHPDSLRRFRVMEGIDELRAALDAPFERWTVFLHPAQRGVVERDYSGPARVAGSAGTGKTVVALHRVMRHLRREPRARILLTTFSEPLARALGTKLDLLTSDRPDVADRVTIGAFSAVARDLVTLATGRTPRVADAGIIRAALSRAAESAGVVEFSPQFLLSEWEHVVDAWGVTSAEAYAEVPRMGRKSRLGARQRERLWQVFAAVRESLNRQGVLTPASLFAHAAELYGERVEKPFDAIIVDEAQDLGVPELRFLAAIAPVRGDALFFAGDLGQRIFQQPFSWKGLGVDVRGRSATLKVNYRTSHQIRRAADRLLPKSVRDVDGLEDERGGTVSVFDGPEPQLFLAKDEEAETKAAAAFLKAATADGIAPGEIGLFVRSEKELARARACAEAGGLPIQGDGVVDGIVIGTMHLAKGLEFRAVAVVACDEDVLPLPARIDDVADEFELDEVMATERQLLYVAATRARDRLFISGIEPGSEFLEDLTKAWI